MCVSFVNGLVNVERLLECTRKAADHRIFFHTNYAIKIGNYECFVIYLLIQIYLYPQYIIFANWSTLIWLRFVSCRGNSRTFFPIHDITYNLDSNLVEVLPVTHALIECVTASKVGTKGKLSGKELTVTTYCAHLAGMHWVMKWLLMLRSFS